MRPNNMRVQVTWIGHVRRTNQSYYLLAAGVPWTQQYQQSRRQHDRRTNNEEDTIENARKKLPFVQDCLEVT